MVAAWIVAVTLAGCGQVEPGPPNRSAAPRPAEDVTVVAYAFEEDVWLYDDRSGRVERLTSDRFERRDHSPRFRDRNRLTFVSMSANKDHSAVVEVDLAAGTRRTLFEIDGALWAYDWNSDGSTLVYVTSVAGDPAGDGRFAHEVRLVDSGGAVSTLRRFDGLWGRGTFANFDEVAVDWSPDGSGVLVVDTHLHDLDADTETLFVLSLDGADLVAPRPGIWARWGGDPGTVVYVGDGGTLRRLDTATGTTRALPGTGASHRLAVSPDGRLVAYDDGAADPAVYLYDLEDGTARRLADHAVGPLWLSPGTLAAGHAAPCVETETIPCEDAGGHGPPWADAGDGWHIDVTTGRVNALPVASTVDAAVARTSVDALLRRPEASRSR